MWQVPGSTSSGPYVSHSPDGTTGTTMASSTAATAEESSITSSTVELPALAATAVTTEATVHCSPGAALLAAVAVFELPRNAVAPAFN